jgi:hypothetical protein
MAYQEALDNLSGQGRGRHLIQMKIDATGPGRPRMLREPFWPDCGIRY